MAEIVSCAKDTQLHSFPALELLSSSSHVVNNGSSCQFFGSSKLFMRANKDWGIELLRLKYEDDQNGTHNEHGSRRTIASVKKIMIDNLYCVACPKSAGKEEIAIGLTTGTVRFMDYKKASFTKRFDADRITIGVTFMDFNATDDFLAAVYENGLVNVYGMKTNSKLHTLAFDKNTIKARFHPTKRFSMAVASYNGAVLLYDTQSKKTIFSQTMAHGAPCRDIAMVDTYPDYLFSVGYDSVINIFDTRRKEKASQIQSNYPFESLAIAENGHHFAVGNLKGFVYGYDLRSLKEPLNMQKIHQSSVNSIAFVPASRDVSTRRSMIELDELKQPAKGTQDRNRGAEQAMVTEPQLPVGQEQHDSFMGEIDLFLQRREAPMDCLSRLSTSSRLSTESRTSMHMAGNNLMGFLDDLSDCNIEHEAGDPTPPVGKSQEHHHEQDNSANGSELSVDDSFVNVNRLLKRLKTDGTRSNASSNSVYRKGAPSGMVSVNDNLENIREEATDIEEDDDEVATAGARTNGTQSKGAITRSITTPRILIESQLENSQVESVSDDARRNVLNDKKSQVDETRPVSEPAQPAPAAMSGGANRKDSELAARHDIAELRKAMMGQFEECMLRQIGAEQDMKSHLWMCMFNLWRETQNKLDSLEQYVSTVMGLLLPRDEFVQQFLSIRAENEHLRAQLEKLEQQKKKG
ncbi:uncharacterized protein LOC128724034 [Anopheles nili]|uniref:uncharacterized protein LOC128724034 n=1 Tax=Anopheles nili TaxID=185578 RepID=UPI00237B07D1|nr:uncharacterized protein LOC128724034 [Anopheles nili]